ncbi:hypothetical protein P3S68_030847 [Capsicum galapagoense]
MMPPSIVSFLLVSLLIHNCVVATARSIQQYDNSYNKLFSQFKVARELRGFKGKKTTILSPPKASKGSRMHLPPMMPLPRPSPPPPPPPLSTN